MPSYLSAANGARGAGSSEVTDGGPVIHCHQDECSISVEKFVSQCSSQAHRTRPSSEIDTEYEAFEVAASGDDLAIAGGKIRMG